MDALLTRTAALVAGAALAACAVEGDYTGTRFTCSAQDPSCPSGFTCRSDVCTPDDQRGDAAPGDDASADAAVSDAVASDAASPCTDTPPLADDFNDGQVGSQWVKYQSGMAIVVEAGGELIARPPSGQGGNRSAGYRSAAAIDVRGKRSFVRVPVMVGVTTTARAYFRIGTSSDAVAFEQTQGDLRLVVDAAGVSNPVATVDYDPAAHRWWQLREADGTVTWETSSDGATWTPRATAPTPSGLATATFDLGAGTTTAVATPGEAHFDDLDTGVGCQ